MVVRHDFERNGKLEKAKLRSSATRVSLAEIATKYIWESWYKASGYPCLSIPVNPIGYKNNRDASSLGQPIGFRMTPHFSSSCSFSTR